MGWARCRDMGWARCQIYGLGPLPEIWAWPFARDMGLYVIGGSDTTLVMVSLNESIRNDNSIF